jgi:hypothetical protein
MASLNNGWDHDVLPSKDPHIGTAVVFVRGMFRVALGKVKFPSYLFRPNSSVCSTESETQD